MSGKSLFRSCYLAPKQYPSFLYIKPILTFSQGKHVYNFKLVCWKKEYETPKRKLKTYKSFRHTLIVLARFEEIMWIIITVVVFVVYSLHFHVSSSSSWWWYWIIWWFKQKITGKSHNFRVHAQGRYSTWNSIITNPKKYDSVFLKIDIANARARGILVGIIIWCYNSNEYLIVYNCIFFLSLHQRKRRPNFDIYICFLLLGFCGELDLGGGINWFSKIMWKQIFINS